MSNPSEAEVPQLFTDQLPADPVILDVREDDEWAAGHIDGAVHIPLHELPGRLAELPDTDTLVVTCRSGGRSSKATAYLLSSGINAVNLGGGMKAWDMSGRPMVSDTGAPPEVG